VLAKLFAVDLADEALAKGNGLSPRLIMIFTRKSSASTAKAFDIYVFRSFARSFWHLLRRSAEEVGYRVE
jgi:heterotetrameric sarcosine oxidase gamma subunit